GGSTLASGCRPGYRPTMRPRGRRTRAFLPRSNARPRSAGSGRAGCDPAGAGSGTRHHAAAARSRTLRVRDAPRRRSCSPAASAGKEAQPPERASAARGADVPGIAQRALLPCQLQGMRGPPADKLSERVLGCPAELRAGPGRVALEVVHLGGPDVARIGLDILAPVEARLAECRLDELPDRMRLARRDHVVVGL